jgi:site-specific recombinase XerD
LRQPESSRFVHAGNCQVVTNLLMFEVAVWLSPHSIRVTGITAPLTQGVPLEDVQYLAGHAEPRTTTLYDRRKKKVTRNIVERIPI